jgi:hypothetical protein
MASIGAPLQRSFRSANSRWLFTLFVFVAVLWFADGAIWFSSRDERISSADFTGVLDVLVGVLWIAMAIVWARRKVTTSEAGVVVRNGLGRRFIRWDDISGFCFGNEIQSPSTVDRIASPQRTPYILLHNGRRVRMLGLAALTVTEAQTTIQRSLTELEAQRRYFTGNVPYPGIPE